MKAIISAIAAAALFSMTACNTSALNEKEAELAIKQHTIDSMNMAMAKQQALDSMSEVTRYQYVVPQQVTPTSVTYAAPARRSAATYVRRSSVRRYAAYRAPVYRTVYAQPAQRRGWSAKAKGALIGGGTGAVAGAIINGRNRAAGALIGGLLGAGAGTGIGAIIDHRNGR